MDNIFIDTGGYLAFYHLTNDDIEELKKLVALLEANQISLTLPQQVCDEYWRNREGKILQGLNALKQANLKVNFPAFSRGYPEYEELKESLKNAAKSLSALQQKALSDAESNALGADMVIAELFKKANIVECDEDILDLAQDRFERGNPPRKNDRSVGDAINWEAVLAAFDGKSEDLHIIVDDGDYLSELDKAKPKEFLRREWEDRVGGELFVHRSISGFLNANYPDIKLADEIMKDALIADLAISGNFASTHSLMAKLSKISDFGSEQIEALVSAAESNSQVNWILGDADVHGFYKGLLTKYQGTLDEELASRLTLLTADYADDDDDEIPF